MSRFRPIFLFLALSAGLHIWASREFNPGIGAGYEFKTDDEELIELTPLPETYSAKKEIIELPPLPETEAPEKFDYLAERNLKVAFQTAGPLEKPSSAQIPTPPSIIMEIEEKDRDSDITVVNTKALFPSYRDLKDWLEDEPGRIDRLEGVPQGDVTLVNAHAFSYKHVMFINQLKRTLLFYWNPAPALLLSSVTYPYTDLETRVLVVFEKNGALSSVKVLKSSGYSRVDNAAVEAFQRTAPIYNIPEEMLNDGEQLEMIWGFIIELR